MDAAYAVSLSVDRSNGTSCRVESGEPRLRGVISYKSVDLRRTLAINSYSK
jgi:hypothetical protein